MRRGAYPVRPLIKRMRKLSYGPLLIGLKFILIKLIPVNNSPPSTDILSVSRKKKKNLDEIC